jgi:hypothetical protein
VFAADAVLQLGLPEVREVPAAIVRRGDVKGLRGQIGLRSSPRNRRGGLAIGASR